MILEQIFGRKKLTDSERQIAAFIEQNPRHAVKLSLEEFSAQCFVSQASIIRFCKKLGAKGFSDFRIRMAESLSSFALNDKEIHVDIPISPTADSQEIAETFLKLSTQTLQHTFQHLDYTALRRASLILSRSDIVHIYGRGESLILAEDFHYKLIRIGIQSSLECLNGFQEAKCLHTGGRLRQSALLISHYCNSRQVNYIVDELTSAKIPYILVTAAEKAWPYENLAATTLRVTNTESRFKMGSFASRTALLYLLDCLYGQIFALNYEENKNNLTQFSQRKIERSYFYNSNIPSDSYE